MAKRKHPIVKAFSDAMRSAKPAGKSKYEIFDENGTRIGSCEAFSIQSAIDYARRRYGIHATVRSERKQ